MKMLHGRWMTRATVRCIARGLLDDEYPAIRPDGTRGKADWLASLPGDTTFVIHAPETRPASQCAAAFEIPYGLAG